MAERLERFPGGPTQGAHAWEEWLDGSPWLLRRGEDCEIETASMRPAASRAAKAAGKRVHTRVISDEQGEALAIEAYGTWLSSRATRLVPIRRHDCPKHPLRYRRLTRAP